MPHIRLKPPSRQIIVITGASSGIGLATARRAARIFLISRNEAALRGIVEELKARGAQAEFALADVGGRAALEAAAERARQVFGGFDSW